MAASATGGFAACRGLADRRNSNMSTSTFLTTDERQQFHELGYRFPIRVLDGADLELIRRRFFEYREQCLPRLQQLPINQQYRVFCDMHFAAGWVYKIVTSPQILDAVESVIGGNILAWMSQWFAKMPGEKTFVSWHQDGMYWELSPPKIVTAWVALSPSNASNGGLRVVPGTHLQPAMPHKETYQSDNALSRGQDIAVDVDESKAVDIELQPGEMSLHHLWIVHGSKANTSPDTPRIGIAIRYLSTEVRQNSPTKPLAMLVRGRDDFGNFELLPPPTRELLGPDDPDHAAIVDRIRASITQGAK
jgi:non-heme Fe2+,alpha-ketoglutarate-dependent halogenase